MEKLLDLFLAIFGAAILGIALVTVLGNLMFGGHLSNHKRIARMSKMLESTKPKQRN